MESRAIEDRADIVLLILRLSTTSNIHTNGCSSCFTPSDGLDSHRWRDTVWVEKYIVPVGQISKKTVRLVDRLGSGVGYGLVPVFKTMRASWVAYGRPGPRVVANRADVVLANRVD